MKEDQKDGKVVEGSKKGEKRRGEGEKRRGEEERKGRRRKERERERERERREQRKGCAALCGCIP